MFVFFLNKFITLLSNNNLLTVDVYYKFVNHNSLMYMQKQTKQNLIYILIKQKLAIPTTQIQETPRLTYQSMIGDC